MYYLQRVKDLGFSGLVMVMRRFIRRQKFSILFKSKALSKQASSTWQDLQVKYGFPPFQTFYQNIQRDQTFERLLEHPRFKLYTPPSLFDAAKVVETATTILQGKATILGARLMDNNECDWHNDTKSASIDNFGQYAKTFYQDIIPAQYDQNADYTADIKIPWERSRFQHFFPIGMAYRLTADQTPEAARLYADFFIHQSTDWLQKNHYLLGVNWICPMDVALRAVNLIWGITFFKKEPSIQAGTFEQLISLLWDHLMYLEHHWEESDKPNNHYLANLVGALYLTIFFQQIPFIAKKISPLIEKIDKAFTHQVLPDGSSYEGSTAYHKLITELHLHYSILCEITKHNQTKSTIHRETNMLSFLEQTTCNRSTMLTIGDDDSSKFVAGLTCPFRKNIGITSFNNFGLTIIRKHDWFMSLRHATFTKKQPSGHFHYDQLAVTLSMNDIPVLIDPGSYCYTASPYWRNQFRSYHYHNTFSLTPTSTGESSIKGDLFQLERKQLYMPATCTEDADHIQLYAKTPLIPFDHGTAHRSVTMNAESIVIRDSYDAHPIYTNNYYWQLCWTFIFHPEIVLTQKKNLEWLISHDRTPIAQMTTSLPLRKVEGYFSPEYGIKIPTTRLMVLAPLNSIGETIITKIVEKSTQTQK